MMKTNNSQQSIRMLWRKEKHKLRARSAIEQETRAPSAHCVHSRRGVNSCFVTVFLSIRAQEELMAFEDVGAPVWKGIGISSSLVLIILSIYDVCMACWLFTEFSEHDHHHLPLDIVVESYPGNYDVFRFAWVIASVLLVVLHGFVFYGYYKNSESIMDKCRIGVIAAVIVLVLLSTTYGSILADRHGFIISFIGHEIALLTTAFLSTLAVEAVLMLALILGK